MIKRVLPAAAAAVFVLGLTAGCGGDDGRPSAEEISKSITENKSGAFDGDIPQEAADCVGEAFHDSDLSDEALQAIVDGDEDYDPSKEDEEALDDLGTDSLRSCIEDAMPSEPSEE